jgi:hypothetical protein
MSRIQISLPEAAIDQLRTTAATTGEPTSRVAARLLLSVLAGDSTARPRVAPSPEPQPEQPKPRPRRGSPPWLEPFDEDEARIWRQEMWGSILALCRRYPAALGRLAEEWWLDSRLVELLSCMATWRTNIDAASEDPREEFAFHTALQQIARLLDQIPGGERRFNANMPMPTEWGRPRSV